MHAYFSKVDGAKKYWGYPEAKVTEKGYENFIRNAIESYRFIGELSQIYRTIIFDYNALVITPGYIVSKIMNFIDVEYEESQLNYFRKGLQAKKLMGDPSVLSKSQRGIGISTESIIKREKEAAEFTKQLKSDFWQRPEIQALGCWIQQVKNEKIITDPKISKRCFINLYLK